MTPLRIGIPIVGGRHWMAGVTYVEMLARAAASLPPARRPDLYLVLRPETLVDMEYHIPLLPLFKGVILWIPVGIDPAPFRRDSFAVCAGEPELFARIDFFYPVISDAWERWCSASWIPDFQHHFLPEFFSSEEIASRNAAFAKVAEKARLLVLSSETVRRDFRRFHPDSQAATRVLSFFSYIDREAFGRDARATADAYGLPGRFLLCCNQFWMHKDHGTLFRALAALRAKGENIPLVCTGSTSDYRAAQYFRELEASLQRLGLAQQVRILGMIPRGDQVQLMRRCCALVQPSLFEGWSSIVEDAKSLGKPIFLSDLDVHREQAPEAGFFFKAGDAASLARAIGERYSGLTAGPDTAREDRARNLMAERMQRFGETFLEAAEAAVGLYSGSARSGGPGISLHDGLAAAEAAYREGRGQEALDLLEELLRQSPGNARVLNDLGVVLHAHGERRLAIDCFFGAAEADPDYPDPVVNLGEIFSGAGPDSEAASQDRSRYLRILNELQSRRAGAGEG